MKSIPLSSMNLYSTLGMVTIGAATGAIVGSTAFVAYTVLTGKSAAAALTAKSALSMQGTTLTPVSSGSRLLGLLLPASIGALGGGLGGLSLARKKTLQARDVSTESVKEPKEQDDTENQSLQPSETHLTKTMPVPNTSEVDLEQIKGIGPKYSSLLQKAGIHTVEDLAMNPLEDIHSALNSSLGEQKFRLKNWVTQARQMVEQKAYSS
ncbi:MAG: Unknown protein [uncultured Thiotrichaceae bacterium]|uniref:DUF4332 domain-containing protein n=1 Tax=uncultured Thiotrichaceae bacterium TaxID=298394 RepID=A0A6S6UI69_9GAMM|nr:MAG: Unknown protein [uncultured Thiotrichaceae bacterium]